MTIGGAFQAPQAFLRLVGAQPAEQQIGRERVSKMAAGGPAGNTRATLSGTGNARPITSVTVAARTTRGASSAAELNRLRALARQGPVTLVFSAHDEAHNDAVVLRELRVGLHAKLLAYS